MMHNNTSLMMCQGKVHIWIKGSKPNVSAAFPTCLAGNGHGKFVQHSLSDQTEYISITVLVISCYSLEQIENRGRFETEIAILGQRNHTYYMNKIYYHFVCCRLRKTQE